MTNGGFYVCIQSAATAVFTDPTSPCYRFRTRRRDLSHDRARNRTKRALHDHLRLFGSVEQSLRGCWRVSRWRQSAHWRTSLFSVSQYSRVFGYRVAGQLLLPVVVAMCLVSVWLIYLQAFVIHAFCQFCLLSAAVTFTLTGLLFLVGGNVEY